MDKSLPKTIAASETAGSSYSSDPIKTVRLFSEKLQRDSRGMQVKKVQEVIDSAKRRLIQEAYEGVLNANNL